MIPSLLTALRQIRSDMASALAPVTIRQTLKGLTDAAGLKWTVFVADRLPFSYGWSLNYRNIAEYYPYLVEHFGDKATCPTIGVTACLKAIKKIKAKKKGQTEESILTESTNAISETLETLKKLKLKPKQLKAMIAEMKKLIRSPKWAEIEDMIGE